MALTIHEEYLTKLTFSKEISEMYCGQSFLSWFKNTRNNLMSSTDEVIQLHVAINVITQPVTSIFRGSENYDRNRYCCENLKPHT
jgi:hypothetical protein